MMITGFVYQSSLKSYPIHLYPEYFRNQNFGIYPDAQITVLIGVLLYKWRTDWKWKGLILAGWFGVRYLLYKAGVVHYKAGWWFLFLTFLDVLGPYFLAMLMDYLLRKNKAVNESKPE